MRRVVFLASQCAHLLAFRARRPGEQLLEVGEPARAAAVLRRARALAAGALRLHRGRIRHGAGLDGKLVLPAIAEVVLVAGQVPGLHQVTDLELPLVERLELIVQIRGAVFPGRRS